MKNGFFTWYVHTHPCHRETQCVRLKMKLSRYEQIWRNPEPATKYKWGHYLWHKMQTEIQWHPSWRPLLTWYSRYNVTRLRISGRSYLDTSRHIIHSLCTCLIQNSCTQFWISLTGKTYHQVHSKLIGFFFFGSVKNACHKHTLRAEELCGNGTNTSSKIRSLNEGLKVTKLTRSTYKIVM